MSKPVSILLMVIPGFVLGYFLHWSLSFIVVIPVVFFDRMPPLPAFLSGFLALFILWGFYAAFLDWQNASILSEKIGHLLGGISNVAVILLTALLGALGGGLVGWSSSLLALPYHNKK